MLGQTPAQLETNCEHIAIGGHLCKHEAAMSALQSLYLIDGLWVDKPLWGFTTGCYTVWGSDIGIEAAHIAHSCSTGAGIGTARTAPDHVMQMTM